MSTRVQLTPFSEYLVKTFGDNRLVRNHQSSEKESIPEAVTHLLEECRMVLPGIQTLFGFQLIAVFNSTFSEKLSPPEQKLHLLAISLVVIAIALVMTPAAYHRQTASQQASTSFIRIASRLLLLSMFPLMIALCLDAYLIAHLILGSELLSMSLSVFLLLVFTMLWFVFPRWRRRGNG